MNLNEKLVFQDYSDWAGFCQTRRTPLPRVWWGGFGFLSVCARLGFDEDVRLGSGSLLVWERVAGVEDWLSCLRVLHLSIISAIHALKDFYSTQRAPNQPQFMNRGVSLGLVGNHQLWRKTPPY